MAKKTLQLKAFEGGINQSADPRDIAENELEEIVNAYVSKTGRIVMPGDCRANVLLKNAYDTNVSPWSIESVLSTSQTSITSGYGLFTFAHDYDFGEWASVIGWNPKEVPTEFICINNGPYIDIWQSNWSTSTESGTPVAQQDSSFSLSIIGVGTVEEDDSGNKPLIDYYFVDGGLRICDGNFLEQDDGLNVDETFSATDTILTHSATGTTLDNNKYLNTYIRIGSEILKIVGIGVGTINVKRGQLGTTATTHADSSYSSIIYINIPKIFTHISGPLLEKANANISINRWIEDCQYPEAPDNYGEDALTIFNNMDILGLDTDLALNITDTVYPTLPEKVFMSFKEASSELEYGLHDDGNFERSSIAGEDGIIMEISKSGGAVLLTEDNSSVQQEGFNIGSIIVLSGTTDAAYDGSYEIIGYGDTHNKIKIAAEFSEIYAQVGTERVILEKNSLSDELKNKYIFGMSFLYGGGGEEQQESNITIARVRATGSTINDIEANGYLPDAVANMGNSTGWNSMDASYGNVTGFSYVEANEWDQVSAWGVAKDSNGTYLYNTSSASSVEITAETYYDVYIELGTYTDGGLNVGVGWNTAAGKASADNYTLTNLGNNSTHVCRVKSPATANLNSAIQVIIEGTTNASIYIGRVQVSPVNSEEMSALTAIDFRAILGSLRTQLSFLCNYSRSGSTQNNSWNERIDGFRIYIKQVNISSTELVNEWLLLSECDIKKGTYKLFPNNDISKPLQLEATWNATDSTPDTDALVTSDLLGDFIQNIPLDTYESENGYKADTNLFAMYKTSTIINRKVFIGNLKIGDRTYPDRMLRSDIDKFDIFPSDGAHYIDVAVGDGDDIIKLESTGENLIQFKKNAAYLIKVTSEGEELASTWQGLGVKSPSQVCKAGNGIAWVNNNGLYYFDGEDFKELIAGKLDMESWIVNEDEDTPVVIGYDSKSSKLIINTMKADDTGSYGSKTNTSGGYIYDFKTESFVRSANLFSTYVPCDEDMDKLQSKYIDGADNKSYNNTLKFGGQVQAGGASNGDGSSGYEIYTSAILGYDVIRTNMANMPISNKLIIAKEDSLMNSKHINTWDDRPHSLWNHTNSADEFNITTRDIDFADPSRRKKVYKVYVTFKAGKYMSGVILKYATNGSNDFADANIFQSTTYYDNAKGFDSYNGGTSTEDWITVGLKPTSSINNIYSMQLKFEYANAGAFSRNAQTSGVNTITLASNGSAVNDYYNGMPIYILHSNASSMEEKRITGYVGSTKVATVNSNWDVKPDGGTYYDVGYIRREFAINDITITYRNKPIK